MEGPSPLLPAWLDFWLQPSRAAWNRGLKSGVSPLLLPAQSTASDREALPEDSRYPVRAFSVALLLQFHLLTTSIKTPMVRVACQYSSDVQGVVEGFGDMIPSEAVLQRSQFLEPLDLPTQQLYNRVLHGA